LDFKDADNPKALYKQGVLARDGGHFQALFAGMDDEEAKARALDFQAAAASFILRRLPGLRFDISIRPIPPPAEKDPIQAQATLLLTLPGLQVCEESGRGIASDVFPLPDIDRYISRAVLTRKQRGESFRGKAVTGDIASLLADRLPHKNPPKTFDELCGKEYLALIHADGNGIGDWSNRVRGQGKPQNVQGFINQEARGEAFYHAMRVAVRKAVVAALDEVFKPEGFGKHDPYRLLMLGGDDLLLVCRAEFALPFVLAYAKALAGIKTLRDCTPGKPDEYVYKPLTVGVGVAIAKPSFPFHRLHQIAEALASSAKRLVRGEQANQASVVDWTICTEAWMDEVAQARQAEVIRYAVGKDEEILALSSKPYFILNQDCHDAKLPTLEWLLGISEALKKTMPRSQRRALVGELRRGRRHAELCVRELRLSSPAAWQALQDAGWVDKNGGPALWNGDGGHYATTYADAVELAEIAHLKLGEKAGEDKP
jgi:hypothetical protein